MKNNKTIPALFLALLGSIVGTIITHLIIFNTNLEGETTEVSEKQKVENSRLETEIAIRDFSASVQEKIPEIYFGLTTVIQGITLAILGDSIIKFGLSWPINWITWTMIIASFLLAITYWLELVMGYLYLFRVTYLSASNHIIATFFYFGIGLSQIIAFSSIDSPSIWLAAITSMAFLAALHNGFIHKTFNDNETNLAPLSSQIKKDHKKLFWQRLIILIILVGTTVTTILYPETSYLVLVPLIGTILTLIDAVRDFKKRQDFAKPNVIEE